eukprot:gene6911-7455_t
MFKGLKSSVINSLQVLLTLFSSRIHPSQAMIHHSVIRKIDSSKLGVSEPHPSGFGNRRNEGNENPNWTNKNWLKSRFHFSFADYMNPANGNFGVLRVMNDDLVQPKRGFGAHPHRNAEICTYVVDGELTHQDSMGTEETLSRGAIQFMTAGRGISHSEHNLNDKDPLRFIQIWIQPRQSSLTPNYGSYRGDKVERRDRWAHLVSDVEASEVKTPIKIQQDANIFVTEFTIGKTVEFEIRAGRQAYLICLEGNVKIVGSNGQEVGLSRHDGAELHGQLQLSFTAISGDNKSGEPSRDRETRQSRQVVHLLLVEMAATGSGRTDL